MGKLGVNPTLRASRNRDAPSRHGRRPYNIIGRDIRSRLKQGGWNTVQPSGDRYLPLHIMLLAIYLSFLLYEAHFFGWANH